MKKALSRTKRIVIIIISVLIVFILGVIIFISPLTKYLIEKYDVKWTGREIKMKWAYVNPFTGYIYLRDVKIYEEHSDSVALAATGLSGTFNMSRMLEGFYEISDLTLDHPLWMVVKNKDDWNFTSFIRHISGPPDTAAVDTITRFNILSMKIKEGEFHYYQEEGPITYYIKDGNFESDGKLFDADSVIFRFFFLSGPGSGSIEGTFTVNFKSLDYHYDVAVHQYDISQIEQYLNPLVNYGTFSANLDANLKSGTKLRDADDVTSRGQLSLNDFHFGKNHKDDYASFDKLTLAINELSPKKKKYLFDSLLLYHPYFKYEQYDRLDNVQTMFVTSDSLLKASTLPPAQFNLILEIARYVKELARNFFDSYYKINNLAIYNADLQYNDYSLSEKFSVDLDPLDIVADSIDKNLSRVGLSIRSAIEPYGHLALNLSINPKDTGDFDMEYHIQKVPVSLYNPYIITYTSFPLDRGTIEVNGTWHVRKGRIKSDNHVVIIDPRVTKRVKKKDAKWIPMPLVMAFIRERGNVIDYQIPITGNLKNPKFHLQDVLFDILKNIFVKPPTTAYRMEVKNVENEIEKSLTLKWAMCQNSLQPGQEKFVKKMVDFLSANPEASISIRPEQYANKEKEHILFFLAKKKFFLSSNTGDKFLTVDDSEKVEKMSIRDPSFLHYLDKQNKGSLIFAIQEKCSKLISPSAVNDKFKQLNKERKENFLSLFNQKGVSDKVHFLEAENIIPYNGFSFYKIDYKGIIPESLSNAYEQMNELNDRAPRKQFEQIRKKDKAPVYDVKLN